MNVSSFYNGADAQTVESAVTIPLERSINGVEGLQYITSTSGNDGGSGITATFDVSRDPDLAAVDVQNRVQAALGVLPAQVKNTGVTVTKGMWPASFLPPRFIRTISKYSGLFISNYVDVYVSDAIKRVLPGVANVTVFGERLYSMRLWLDPARLASARTHRYRCCKRLARAKRSVWLPARLVNLPRQPAKQFQISVRAMGQLIEPAEFDNIILKTGTDGTLVLFEGCGSLRTQRSGLQQQPIH